VTDSLQTHQCLHPFSERFRIAESCHRLLLPSHRQWFSNINSILEWHWLREGNDTTFSKVSQKVSILNNRSTNWVQNDREQLLVWDCFQLPPVAVGQPLEMLWAIESASAYIRSSLQRRICSE
jgi:hypothetical protein